MSVFKKDQNLPAEIRALKGEYTDPNLVFARTIMKTATIAAHHKFLSQMKQSGMGVFLFNESDTRPVEFNVKIAADNSPGMAPLEGLYTTPEIKKQLENVQEETGKLIETWMKVISVIKWAKTIGSFATHAKNVIGNLSFLAMNGHINIKDFGRAYNAVQNDFRGRDRKGQREAMNHYISLGIVKQSAGLGEIRDMFKDAHWDVALAERLATKKLGPIGKLKRFGARQKKVLEDAYQAEDDFFKIIAFESESARYAKALHGKKVSELTPEQKTEIDVIAAEIVKNTLPTYSRVPEIFQKARRSPLVGSFVAFAAESYRTGWNTAVIGMGEMSKKETMNIGVRRFIGASTYMAAKSAVLSYTTYAAGAGVTGVLGLLTNSDEEEEKDKAMRRFLPEWSVDSDLAYSNVGDGKFTYVDMSASDPWGAFNKVINAGIKSDTKIEALFESGKSFIEPFVGTEIATDAALQLHANADGYGRPIYNITDSLLKQSADVLLFLKKVVEPGTLTSINRILDSDKKMEEVVAAVTGYRSRTVDVVEQAGYMIRDIHENVSLAKQEYNFSVKKYDEGDVSAEDLEQIFLKANSKVKEIYSEMKEVWKDAEKLGVTRNEFWNTMESKSIPKEVRSQVLYDNKVSGFYRKR